MNGGCIRVKICGRLLLLWLINVLWKASQGSFFGCLVGQLSLSLWLTQWKPLGSRGSNSRRQR